MANEQNLIPFVKGQSGNPKGRPKKTYAQHAEEIEEKGYKAPSLNEYYNLVSLLLTMTEDDLKEFATDKSKPYWIRLIILDLNDKKNRQRLMGDYRDWLFGKSKQTIDLEAKVDGELTITRRIISGDFEK